MFYSRRTEMKLFTFVNCIVVFFFVSVQLRDLYFPFSVRIESPLQRSRQISVYKCRVIVHTVYILE